MARKEAIVTIPASADNRDAGKIFVITEMSAVKAEKWATRALLALSRSGVELDPQIIKGGLAGIAVAGIRAITSIAFYDAEPLLDEMMQCVELMPDPKLPMVKRALVENDIDELGTMLLLRSEVINLHVGFSIAAELSKLGAAAKADLNISNTQTSPEPSEPSLAAD
jgi:hypothetical protein